MQYRPNNCGDSMSRTTPHNVAWAGANKICYTEKNQQRRPDHAGPEGEAVTKEIIGQFNSFLNGFMSHSFNSYYENKKWKPGPDAVTPFQDILKKIIDFDCEIEIIGYWIYCFKSYSVHEQLKELGFWFSSKHKAWVYSGRAKRLRAGKETLDEIRARSDFSPRAVRKLKRRNRSKRKNTSKKSQFSPNAPACAGGVYSPKGVFIMMLPVFSGQKYSYSYETETGHYLLHDNEYKSHVYLQGDDARIFRKEIERIDELPEPEYKTGLGTV